MDAETKTLEKFNKAQERAIRDSGYGATTGGLAVTKAGLERLTDFVRVKLEEYPKLRENDPDKAFLYVIRNLAPDTVALSALQSGLHSIARGALYRDTCLAMGRRISHECWAAGLLAHNEKLARRINNAVRKRHGNEAYRRQAARSIAKKAGYMQAHWTNEEHLRAGHWLAAAMLEALPDLFTMTTDQGGVLRLTITEGALALAEAVVSETIARNPVHLPMTEPPLPWTDWNKGGYRDEQWRHATTLVRGRKETQAAVRAAIRDGTMQPVLDAVNALQDVAWTINGKVLEVLKQCHKDGVSLKGLPRKDNYSLPEKLKPWEDMTDPERRLWKYRAEKVRLANLGLCSERVLFHEDLETARSLQEAGRFWTPCNMDWRGRVYPLPHFNFQRDDRIRALFLFADGAPIGEEGLDWLRIHVANCGDFDKVSKAPLEERIAWTKKNAHRISMTALWPMSYRWWMEADKPFLFLAACIELDAALREGPGYITRLPVSFDGSCSGLQHLCAMTRAAEGALVNLTPSETAQDVYQTVADKVRERVELDAAEGNLLAQLVLEHGVTRKLVKRNVMTYSYSSKKFGMAQQHDEDLVVPLEHEVIAGLREEHPFGVYSNKKHPDSPSPAALYLAKHIYSAIEEVVQKPAQAMAMLQKCARALAHEGKPLSWTTPAGLPWCNRYHEVETQRVELWLSDVRMTIKLATGDKKEIAKDKAANGVAPNFVHALDAAHLQLTVNAAVAEGITQIATVHDSFGCLAPHARRFNAIIREQFVAMYEQHDVLAEVLERAKCDLSQHNWNRLPDVVERGALDLKGVLNAPFAFA
jgi:DNA-directed RNA polymerase